MKRAPGIATASPEELSRRGNIDCSHGRAEVTRALRLQWEQFGHDKQYHPDILVLSVADRMKHMALHFCKYVGQFARAYAGDDEALAERTITDTAIIALASANTLNLDLAGAAGAANDVQDSSSLGLLLDFAEHAGALAKACESTDHLEDYPFREKMSSTVRAIFSIASREASRRGLDLESCVQARWRQVEAKNIFDGFIKGADA